MMKMRESATERCYDLWSRFYDHTFGALVHRRQLRALEALAPEPGTRVLDIGVGTGMTLAHYPDGVEVVGLDLSAGMLRKAVEKVREQGLTQCRLVQADAMHPPFAEASFDHVMISHTVSVVSDPPRLMRWARRLVRPNGRVVVLNHFRSQVAPIGMLERLANPLCVKIGWRSDLSLEDCLDGVGLEVSERFKLRRADLWQIVVLHPRDHGAA